MLDLGRTQLGVAVVHGLATCSVGCGAKDGVNLFEWDTLRLGDKAAKSSAVHFPGR